MSNTDSHSALLHPATIWRRTGVPLTLFAFVLLGVLTLSKFTLLPRLTFIEVAGVPRDITDLRQYHQQLTAQVTGLEADRNHLILPVQDELYLSLLERKRSAPDFRALVAEVRQIAASFTQDDTPVVVLSEFRYEHHGSQSALTVTGDVRNVGPRSMTVLAQFIEALRNVSFATDVASPRFTRREDDRIGVHSPFTITFVL